MDKESRHKWARHLVKLLLLLVVVVVLLLAWPEKVVTVRVVEVVRGPVEKVVTSIQAGEVRARRQAAIRASTIGRVSGIEVQKGDRVEKDQLLVELGNGTLRARLRLARANLEVGQSGLRSARLRLQASERALKRSRRLSSQGVLSQQALDPVQAERDLAAEAVKTAQANIDQLQAAVAVAAAALEETRIRAPFAGQVTALHVEVGEALVAGAPVLDLVDDSQVTLLAPVDEADAGILQTGFPVRVLCDAFAGRQLAGKLTWISPVVSRDVRQNRHLEVEVGFDGQRIPLKPGMSADIEVVVQKKEQVLWVPTNAIMRKGGNEQVFLVAGGRARLQTIQAGISNWERTEVIRGLAEGDRVIVSLEVRGLADGVKVRLGEWAPAGRVAW